MSYREKGAVMETPDNFEARITAALEQHAQPRVPSEFAARVVAGLPAKPAPRRAVHLGRTIIVAVCAVLLVAMIAIAPHAAADFRSPAFELELSLTALLCATACWLGLKWRQV